MKDEQAQPRTLAHAINPPSGGARIPRPPARMRPVWSAGLTRPPRVLLVLRGHERPTQSLLYAVAVARSHEARLHVLAIVPRARGLASLLRGDVAIGRRAIAQTRDTRKALLAWLTELLDTRRAIEHLAVSYGDFVTQSAVYAATIEAKLILIAGCKRTSGTDVTALSRAAETPVLVARGAQCPGTILAATDLLSPDYPVLTQAADFGRRMNGTVVAIHNVKPEPVAGAEVAWRGYTAVLESPEKVRSERLADVVRRMPIVTQAVVSSEHSSADAIMKEATARAADLVVVGTRRAGWLERLRAGSVSAKIVKSTDCSVLVLPLDASASPRTAPDGASSSSAL